MKKYILLVVLFLCGCSTQYYLQTSSTLENGNNSTIKIVSPHNSAAITKLKHFLTKQLKEQEFKIVSAEKKSRYGLVFGIEHRSWQTKTPLPLFGHTGIKSIDTTSFGNTFGNFDINRYDENYYAGSFHAIQNNQSMTDIEYETGIVGFQDIVENNYQTTFTLIIVDYKTHEVVADSSLISTENLSENDFAKIIEQVYSQYPLLKSFNLELICDNRGCKENMSIF